MEQVARIVVGVGFDGLAYGMILFVLAVGLSVTMGIMGVVNLAHGAFAMIGGYLTVVLTRRADLPFLAALILVFFIVGALSAPIERTLFAAIYRRSHLHQVLVTLGMTLISVAGAVLIFGASPYALPVPSLLQRDVALFGWVFSAYRLFVIAVGVAIYIGLWLAVERSTLGAKIRATVDNRAMAENVGVDTTRLFALAFTVGSGLAAVGGALAANVVGLTPQFAIQYLILMLLIVTVGGLGTITGSLAAALIIGMVENVGRYFFPSAGSFLVYLLAAAVLLARPDGLYARRN